MQAFHIGSNEIRSGKTFDTDTPIMKDFSCDKASLGNAWKSPFPLTVQRADFLFQKMILWQDVLPVWLASSCLLI